MKHTRRNTRHLFITAFLVLGFLTSTPHVWAKPALKNHRMMEKFETIKMWKLMGALNLDTKTALKVFPVIKETDQKRAELVQKMRGLIRQLRQQIYVNKQTPGEIDTLASKIFDIKDQICTLPKQEYNKLKPILTRKQLGQYLIFQQHFRRELIRRWILENRGPFRKNRQNNQADRM